MTEDEMRVARNREIIAEFRANGGSVAGFEGTPLLLLHTTGAHSGATRVSPVAYLADGDRYVVFAANGGRERDPAWSRNLRSDPSATVEVAGHAVAVQARFTTGAERGALWARGIEAMPAFNQFTTEREIPVIALEPTTP